MDDRGAGFDGFAQLGVGEIGVWNGLERAGDAEPDESGVVAVADRGTPPQETAISRGMSAAAERRPLATNPITDNCSRLSRRIDLT